MVFSEDFSLGGIALGTIVVVIGWHVARVLAPAEMKEALAREGLHPAAASTFGRVHGDEEMPDPSTVDQVGRPGTPRTH
jgi:hypothetical protein